MNDIMNDIVNDKKGHNIANDRIAHKLRRVTCYHPQTWFQEGHDIRTCFSQSPSVNRERGCTQFLGRHPLVRHPIGRHSLKQTPP